MGKYYKQTILDGRKPLHLSGKVTVADRYEVLKPAQGMRLIGIYDRAILKMVVDVTDYDEFLNFEGQFKLGMFIARDYYHIPESELEGSES